MFIYLLIFDIVFIIKIDGIIRVEAIEISIKTREIPSDESSKIINWEIIEYKKHCKWVECCLPEKRVIPIW